MLFSVVFRATSVSGELVYDNVMAQFQVLDDAHNYADEKNINRADKYSYYHVIHIATGDEIE